MTSGPIPPWQEPYRGTYPEVEMFTHDGLTASRSYLVRGGPRPPISHLIGTMFHKADPGNCVFTMPAADWFLSSQEHVSAGMLMMVADAALGTAAAMCLPPATPMTTWELSMTFLRPIRAGGQLRATGGLIRDDRPLILTDVRIEDDDGDLVAHGTSSCFVLPKVEGLGPPVELEPIVNPVYDTPDPYERPVQGAIIPWETWRTMTGLEILARQIAGDLPQPPIHYLTGMTLREAGEGRVTFSMPATEWLTSPTRFIQGGAIAMLGHAALTTAVTTTLEAGSAYRPVDVKVHFLRPVPVGGEMTATGTVTHRGRSLAVAGADVFGTDGRKVATAVGSTQILPDRA